MNKTKYLIICLLSLTLISCKKPIGVFHWKKNGVRLVVKKKSNGDNAYGFPSHGLISKIICFDPLCRTKAAWKAEQKSMSYKGSRHHKRKPPPSTKPAPINTAIKDNSIVAKKQYTPASSEIQIIEKEKVLDNGIVPTETSNEKIFTFNNLTFETGTAVISAISKSSLDSIIDILKQNPTLKIHIMGHTDHIGTENGNMILSLDRANAVATTLTNAGIAKSRIKTTGFGSTIPLTNSMTEEDRKLNRRVEFSLGGEW